MNNQTKVCQNCKQSFTIDAEDFDFYEKIKVPPPTWCPECRQKRRYAWRNERVLYRRNCDLCGKSAVTIYSPNKPFKVYCPPCWWSDKWTALDYGQEFDFSRPFFKQVKKLQLKVPRIALLTKNSVNSEYTNHSNNNKNCYWSISVFDSENILYGHNLWKKAKDCVDCAFITDGGELLYECIDTERSYGCQFGMLLRDCADCFYCYDCRGCSNCFLSANLRNKQYYFFNKQYSKEEYEKKIAEYNLGSFAVRERLYNEYLEMLQRNALHRYAVIEKSLNSTGNMIFNSKNVQHGFDGEGENLKYVTVFAGIKDSLDMYHCGFNCELIYETHALIHSYDVQFSHLSYDNSHIQYCDSCHNSQNLFGCVGTKQETYAIFNKRYSESEYKTLREKIVNQMRINGEYGEFFPPSLSPFGYNETTGITYMPITKDDAVKNGWKWEEELIGTYGKETIPRDKMPDNILEVGDILKEIFVCRVCKKNFNVVQPELEFYRREKIPLPRECPNCRHARRINLRLPRQLWERECRCAGESSEEGRLKNTGKHFHGTEHCPNKFETPYAPGREEIIYCEQCYNAEIA